MSIVMEEIDGSNSKAHRVINKTTGEVFLFSYCTKVMVYKNPFDRTADVFRYNFRESNTTSRHIKLFCGMDKKKFMELPLIEE